MIGIIRKSARISFWLCILLLLGSEISFASKIENSLSTKLTPEPDSASIKQGYAHLTYSQIGYDIKRPKYFMFRESGTIRPKKRASFTVRRTTDHKKALSGRLRFEGEKWGERWWKGDFSKLEKKGEYYIQLKIGDNEISSDPSAPISIKKDVLWNSTWELTTLHQLEIRAKESYKPEGGWRDCGSTLQELSSHVIMLNSLCDLWEHARKKIAPSQQDDILRQLIIGTDYIGVCQDKAKELGFGDGPVVHEPRRTQKVITGNSPKASMILARVARIVKEKYPAKSANYIQRSIKAFEWAKSHAPITYSDETDNFSIVHGAPKGMKPPKEWMTRDLVMMMWASLELYKSGQDQYKNDAFEYARKVMARQVPADKAEEGLYGHFYTYDSFDFTEKANIHCGALDKPFKNYNQGGHMPHYLIPMLEMAMIWPEHQDRPKWEKTVRDFAYHYFLPATEQNPFGILPAGYYKGVGLLNFSGWYHGHNNIYGYAGALASVFSRYFDDKQFEKIAYGNLQWITGLHCGFPGADRSSSASMIVGIGNVWKNDWDAMKGTITNGFEAYRQFKLKRPTLADDKPSYFGNEGAIHHCAGWVTGISYFYSDAFSRKKH
ncbi:hypothetical protein FUAX_25480 [Fulvitalea axinellae]|uniref:Cellulase Ig-like domain-containing protein n=1 Tax=Fulvitalea axinellae TaxID=1182444 RepID=A0AAU9CDC6_9BACT|nr:hypothetical protein FUAX_25480 [Fulvitalea axinellae]